MAMELRTVYDRRQTAQPPAEHRTNHPELGQRRDKTSDGGMMLRLLLIVWSVSICFEGSRNLMCVNWQYSSALNRIWITVNVGVKGDEAVQNLGKLVS
jgi:hypothetical protein